MLVKEATDMYDNLHMPQHVCRFVMLKYIDFKARDKKRNSMCELLFRLLPENP